MRPDGLRDYTTHVRDLASVEIWERSLARSRQRRRLAEIGRRARRKRKSVSLAVSAALAAVPAAARGVAAADSGSGSAGAGSTETVADGKLAASAQRIVLQNGSQGGLVAAAQRRLNELIPITHLAVDGMFGPLTRGAVLEFQRNHGLAATGTVDALTWAVMFKAPVLVMGGAANAGSAEAGSGSEQPAAASSASEGSAQSAATPAAATAEAAEVSQPSTAQSAGAEAGGGGAGSPSPAEASTTSSIATASSLAGFGMPVGAGSSVADGQGSSTPAVPSAAETPRAAEAPSTAEAPGTTETPSTAETPSTDGAPSTAGNKTGQPLAVVAPANPTPQPSTYVLSNGVALPLPRQYITNGSVDQGVDYAAPGGTPLYAMGEGVIIGEGISGFGPERPDPPDHLRAAQGHGGVLRPRGTGHGSGRPARDGWAADQRGRLRDRRNLDRSSPGDWVLPPRPDGRRVKDALGNQQPHESASCRPRRGNSQPRSPLAHVKWLPRERGDGPREKGRFLSCEPLKRGGVDSGDRRHRSAGEPAQHYGAVQPDHRDNADESIRTEWLAHGGRAARPGGCLGSGWLARSDRVARPGRRLGSGWLV